MRRQVLLTLLSLFLMLSTAWAQYATEGKTKPAKACDHGGFDLWNALRMIPVRFTEFKGDTACWQYQDPRTVKLGSFVLQENAQYISREKKEVSMLYVMERKSSAWLCYYCSQCNALLRAYELKSSSSVGFDLSENLLLPVNLHSYLSSCSTNKISLRLLDTC